MDSLIARLRRVRREALGLNRRNQEFLLRLNPPHLVGLVDHKVQTKEVLSRHGLPVPQTFGRYTRHRELPELAREAEHRAQFVIKPARGAGGEGVMVITGRRDDRLVKASGAVLRWGDLIAHAADIIAGAFSLSQARDEAVDKITGLDCGADDYVVKPFNPEELMARVRALLRRVQPRQIEVLRFQDVEMVPSEREARRNGELLELTAREYELLELFLRHPRRVLSREQILQDVWGFDYLGDSNLVDVRIKYLRDKLELGGRSRLIQTVRGAGYALRA